MMMMMMTDLFGYGCWIATCRHAAYNISIVETTSDSVTVTWYPAYDRGLHIHYVLWYTLHLSIIPNGRRAQKKTYSHFSHCHFIRLFASSCRGLQ